MGSRWDWESVEDRMGRLGKIGWKKGSVVVLMTLKNKWSDNRRVRGCQGVRLRSERRGRIAHVRGMRSWVTEVWVRHSSGGLLPCHKPLIDLVSQSNHSLLLLPSPESAGRLH